jgi:hypothetical protein
MYRIAAHVMAKRSDAQNAIELFIPQAPIKAYIQEKRREGTPVSHLAVFMAGFVRLFAEYPALNRFIVNKTPYARKEIAFGMVVMGAKADEGTANEGTMSKIYFDPNDDVFEVERKIQEYIVKNRKGDNSTEDLMRKLTAVPGVLRFAVNLIKWADKHNLLPKSIIDASPFHCSLVFTNLASIRTNHIYHHCYDFGTTSVVMAAGNLVDVPRSRRGEIVMERMIPLGVCMDERICSGSYYSRCFKLMQKYFADPRLLETPPEKVMPDPEI